MDLKPDGRMYSRITRRCVAVIGEIERGRQYSISEIAAEIQTRELPEFFVERFGKQMSLGRIRDYVRYLVDLKVLSPMGNGYVLDFEPRQTAEDWSQGLSDLALLRLADMLGKKPGAIKDYFEKLQRRLQRERRLPSIDNLVAAVGVSGSRSEEVFKWSLYLFADVAKCPFDIRRYPVLVGRGKIGQEV